MWNGKKVGVVIPAAGQGMRMGGGRAKQFLDLEGKPVLVHAMESLQASPEVDVIIVAADEVSRSEVEALVHRYHLTKVAHVVVGGRERQDSVWNGLQALATEKPQIVLVHDAVRPIVSGDLIRDVCAAVEEHGTGVPAVAPVDTIKQVNRDNVVVATLRRSELRMIQTPQGFSMELLLKAYEKAAADDFHGTDDASLVERMGVAVRLIAGSPRNIKITAPEDLKFAAFLLKETGIKS